MIADIWHSFRRIPVWVQVWIGVVLVPVNLLPLLFLPQPLGGWVALLAVGGMALNLPVMVVTRGISKAMALPHLLLWIPLVILLAAILTNGWAGGAWRTVLWVMLVVDLISLAFDIPDAWRWWRGDRKIA